MHARRRAAKTHGAGHADEVAAALQSYADRGVFRGLSITRLPRGRMAYDFHWLLRPPMRLQFDARHRILAAPSVFPGIAKRSAMADALDAIVAERTARWQPAHKRLDGRRARASSIVRGGSWTLEIAVRGANHQYAVQHALNLINELFLFLQESYPEYLIERFGMSAE